MAEQETDNGFKLYPEADYVPVSALIPHKTGNGLPRLLALAYVRRGRVSLIAAGVVACAAVYYPGQFRPPQAAIVLHPASPSMLPAVVVAAEVPKAVIGPVPAEPGPRMEPEATDDGTAVPARPPAGGHIADSAIQIAGDILAKPVRMVGPVPGYADPLPPRDTSKAVDTSTKSSPIMTEKPVAAPKDGPEPEEAVDAGSLIASMSAGTMEPEDRKVFEGIVERRGKAVKAGESKAVEAADRDLAMFDATLKTVIEFRIVDRDGEKSGFWRPPVNGKGKKQYFVVVEAAVDGETVNWAVKDADTGRIVLGARFGLEVDEATFTALSDDKKENGRIDNLVVGIKPVGHLHPAWSIKTDGRTITDF
jgi:hypothetical protein